MSKRSKTAKLDSQASSETMQVSDYETIRKQNIQRNFEFLESIGIESAKPSLPAPKSGKSRPASRGIAASRSPAVPTRRSSRVTLERVRVEIEDAKKEGDAATLEQKQAILADLEAKKEETSYNHLIKQETTREILSEEPIPMYLLAGKKTPPLVHVIK